MSRVAKHSPAPGIGQEFVVQPHENRLYVHTYGTNDDAVLRENAELRKNRDALRNLDWGVWALSIPAGDWARLVRVNPEIQTDAGMRKFIASAESLPYRVREKI